jgi:hypothetical protein
MLTGPPNGGQSCRRSAKSFPSPEPWWGAGLGVMFAGYDKRARLC